MVVPLISDDPPETLIACRKMLESDDEVAVGHFRGALDLPLIKKLA